jgi:radical SAM protein with 4Fe4S-binding SPASM domain
MHKNIINVSYSTIKSILTGKIFIQLGGVEYQVDKIPKKKLINWFLNGLSAHFKLEKAWGFPIHPHIEPTTYCNLHCAVCPVGRGLGRPDEHLEFSVFKRFIDEIGDYLFAITLYCWGEPFLNPAIYEMIAYAKKKKILILSSTNAHFMKNDENIEKLIQSGLDHLIVDVDGITQTTYQKFRQTGNLEIVLQGIKNLVQRKRDLSSNTPLINLRFIVMKHNEHEISSLQDLALSLGVDVLSIKSFNLLNAGEWRDQNIDFLPANPLYRRFKTVENEQILIKRENNPCLALWNNPVIYSNGMVCTCNIDYSGKYFIGDLKKQNFKDIWNNSVYKKFRHEFHRDWEKLELCNNCTNAFEGGNCADETIKDTIILH